MDTPAHGKVASAPSAWRERIGFSREPRMSGSSRVAFVASSSVVDENKNSPGAAWVRRESGDLPSEMKGVHPEEESNETGSEAPCVMPRGVQQKRSQDAEGRTPSDAKLRAVARSEPRCSPVSHSGKAEPL